MTKVYRTFAKVSSPCLFDYKTRKEALEVNGSPLAKLIAAFNFEKYRSDIVDCVKRETAKKKLTSEGHPKKTLNLFSEQDLAYASPRDSIRLHRKDARGRRAIDPVLMFTIVMFGVRYHLSDEKLAFKLRDSYSFRVFLGLSENDRISRQSIWQYREYFTNGGLCQNLARKHVEELTDAGLVGDSARILDGSFVEAPKQRNTREENYQIKKNDKTADELWGDNPFKARQKDTDARWTKTRSELHYGYKAHVYADEQSKFIIFLKTTPANVHDSQVLEDVLSDEDAGMEFLADSAYSGQNHLKSVESFGMKPVVCEKGTAKTPLTEEQKQNNRAKSKRRCRIEHIFGFIENSMGGSFVRCIGLKRTAAYQWLTMFAYNLCRQVQLQV